MITEAHCIQLDQNDELAPLRQQFALPPQTIYLDGNSLGAQPHAALEQAQHIIRQEWGTDLIKSWNEAGWFNRPLSIGNELAPLIGARPNEVAVTDSTSVNLFKGAAAALQMQRSQPATAQRRIIVTERSNFPTDIYILEGLKHFLNDGYELRLVDHPEQIHQAIDTDVALVVLTHVNYRTGYMLDMADLSAHAHQQEALILWDLCHSAGAVPIDLHAAQADLAVGCTYKYLNAGPGAPAFIWVPEKHQAQFTQPLTGWWAHQSPFEMQPSFQGSGDIRAALCGTQPIISLSLVSSGLAVFKQTSMDKIRTKSLALTDLFIQLLEERCADHPLQLETPREHARRGSQVSIAHPHGYAIIQALIERGVIGDYREPHIMRFGFTPLYTSFHDVWQAVDILKDVLDHQKYDIHLEKNTVT